MRSLFGLILLLALTVASTSAISASTYRGGAVAANAQQTTEPADTAEPSESPEPGESAEASESPDAMEPGDPQGSPGPVESQDVDQTPTTPPTGAP